MGLTCKTLYGRIMKGIDMKKISSVISLSFLVLFFVLAVNAHSGEWILLGENDRGSFLYDKTAISKANDRMVIVDWKSIFSIAAANEAGEFAPTLKGVSFILYRDLINCRERIYESKGVQYYNKEGKLIYDSKTNESKYKPIGFRPIPPDTPIERLADIVCK
jgi:hypothetical protein